MIYICIPAHNEEQTVGVVLWKIRHVMTEFRRDYQIIVADDASTDATPSVLAPYARVMPLTIIRNPERRGYSASLEMLLREAVGRSAYPRRDAIVTLQADFTDDPQDLVDMVKRIEAGADLVAGSKVVTDDAPRGVRWSRRAARWAARGVVPAEAGDPLSSFRVYRVDTLARAFSEAGDRRLLSCDGWAANAQLLRATVPHARRIDTVEVSLRPERLQRPSRLHGWPTLVALFALARGRAPAAGTPAAIEPAQQSQVRRKGIDLDSRELAAAGARNRGNGRAAQPGSRGAAAGRTAQRTTPPRAKRPRGTRGARPADSASKDAAPKDAAPATSEEPRAAADQQAGAAQDPAASGEAPSGERPRRRSRRGGRGRRRRPTDAAATGEAQNPPADAAADMTPADAPGDAPAGADAADDAGAAATPPAGSKRTSRRGSRGGRRRRKGSARDQTDTPTAEPGRGGEDRAAGDGPEGGPADGGPVAGPAADSPASADSSPRTEPAVPPAAPGAADTANSSGRQAS